MLFIDVNPKLNEAVIKTNYERSYNLHGLPD